MDVFQGLNEEQRRAVERVRGPVCILAGAGSGKTTTITRRIAQQVLAGAFRPDQILAVTFTDKAAGEMRARLARLGVENVRASTFHSAAFAQLRALSYEPPRQVLSSKVVALRQIANTLPKPYRFRPAADLATEIEWARNRRITPEAYRGALGPHEPPIPADLMASVFKRYEDGKHKRGVVDFEDLLELAIQMYERDEDATERFRARYLAFTVDEYQDVNLLQESLLRHWVGPRDDLCVVGDDYQSIYGFTGATPRHLLEMPGRFPRTHVVRLEHNYRSTPEILDLANRLVPALGGAEKVLKATRPSADAPTVQTFTTPSDENDFIVNTIEELNRTGIAHEEMAILYRVNFRSEDFEELLAGAGIPFQVRGGAFLARQSARRAMSQLQRRPDTDVAARMRSLAESAGYVADPPDGLGEQEVTRQNDLRRLIQLADEFDDGVRTTKDFVADLQARFSSEGQGRGVNLLTYHRAKGLEFECVFLPRLEEGEMPFKRSKTDEALAEERRLLYVGLTRAKQRLAITCVVDGRRKPSSFLHELGLLPARRAVPRGEVSGLDEVTAARVRSLKSWRLQRARKDEVPAFVVFHDSTLAAIAQENPKDLAQLAGIPGVGPAKLERYGPDLLGALRGTIT